MTKFEASRRRGIFLLLPVCAWAMVASSGHAALVYDNLDTPLPSNVDSLSAQGVGVNEFGDHIGFNGPLRQLDKVTVTMSSWTTTTDFPIDPSGYEHPLTFNIYAVDNSGSSPVPGALLTTVTEQFHIPLRPDGSLDNGIAFNVVFDFSTTGFMLPDEIIFGISYNTRSFGKNPLGVAGPYDSLNVGLSGNTSSTGTNLDPDDIFWDSSFSTGFERSLGWTGYQPAVQFSVFDVPVPEIANFWYGLFAVTGLLGHYAWRRGWQAPLAPAKVRPPRRPIRR
jgi:hypothetical protein